MRSKLMLAVALVVLLLVGCETPVRRCHEEWPLLRVYERSGEWWTEYQSSAGPIAVRGVLAQDPLLVVVQRRSFTACREE